MEYLLVIAIAIIWMWIMGEVHNSRWLRFVAIFLPTLLIGPIAFQFGLMIGDGRTSEQCRTEICALLDATTNELERNNVAHVVHCLKKLRAANDEISKNAGKFVSEEIPNATRDISNPLPAQ